MVKIAALSFLDAKTYNTVQVRCPPLFLLDENLTQKRNLKRFHIRIYTISPVAPEKIEAKYLGGKLYTNRNQQDK